MKKIFLLLLALVLVACGATPSATSAPVIENTSTPVVIVQTVIVPATEQPTLVPSPIPPTAVPTSTTAPTLPAPTDVPTQAASSVPAAANVAATVGPILVPPSFNGSSFKDIQVSGNKFSLRCEPKQITFDVHTTDVYIVRVDMYFRIRDKHSTYIPEFSLGGTMQTDGLDHFWMTLTGEQVKADLRKAQGWFDFQFVGINKLGDSVGRTEKITDIVSYTIDCQ
jgi:hypothetical protein